MQDPKDVMTADSHLHDMMAEFEAFHSADRIRKQNAERQRQIAEHQRQIAEHQKRRWARKTLSRENAYSSKLRASELAVSKRRAKNKAARQQRKRTR
jgi:hypothetical protein